MVKCVRCKYEWDDETDYCKNCGLEMHNNCSNAECILNDMDPVDFNFNDCYCSECGSKTTYYEQGLIEPDLN